jgi:hypothetical protein
MTMRRRAHRQFTECLRLANGPAGQPADRREAASSRHGRAVDPPIGDRHLAG